MLELLSNLSKTKNRKKEDLFMKNIAVIGAGGKMASAYIPIIRQLTDVPLVLVERNRDKWQRSWQAEGFTVLESVDALPACDTAFVLSNTPAHASNLEALVKMGCRHIFVEKPIVLLLKELDRLTALIQGRGGVSIFTAYLMNFSGATNTLSDYIKTRDLFPRTISIEWGKDRTGDSRPTAGGLEDEAVHGMSIVHTLVQGFGLQSVSLSALTDSAPFADPNVQAAARARDESFPEHPIATSFIQSAWRTGKGTVLASLRSSFLRFSQKREANGVLSRLDESGHIHLFSIAFDEKDEEGVYDRLMIREAGSGKPHVDEKFRVNKVRAETEAFLSTVEKNVFDGRLTGLPESAFLTKLVNSCLISASTGGALEVVGT
jgi:predicted dehydrogenase